MKKAIIAFLFLLLLVVGLAFVFLRSNNETIDPDPIKISKKIYIALGDSVAAGVGLPDASDSSACNRTEQSYPVVLAKAMDYKLTNKSCSGATSKEGLEFGQTVNKLLIDPQLSALDPSTKPDLITITVGANDVGWVEKIQSCYLSDCTTALETQTLIPEFVLMQNDASAILAKISTTYNENAPKVLVTGYYPLFSGNTTVDCADSTGLTPTELESISRAQIQLDDAIRDAVSPYPNATFIKLSFQDHSLCSEEPWIQGLNDRQPFHPNEKGQQAIAEQLAASL